MYYKNKDLILCLNIAKAIKRNNSFLKNTRIP